MRKFLFIFAACAATVARAFTFTPPVYTNSFVSNGVTYTQLGAVKASNYVATAASVLPDDYDSLTNNANFKSAVEKVSPPMVLPEKWALSSVTNDAGGKVVAENVDASRMEILPCSTHTNIVNGLLFRFYTITNKVCAFELEWNGRVGMTVIEAATYDNSTGWYTGGLYLPASESDASRIAAWYQVYGFDAGVAGVGVAAYNYDTGTWIVGNGDNSGNLSTYYTYSIDTKKPYGRHGYSVYASLERYDMLYVHGKFVPVERTVNAKPLSSDISLAASDVGVSFNVTARKKIVNNANQISGETTKSFGPTTVSDFTADTIGAHNAITGGVMNGIYPLFTHINPALSVGYSKFHGNQTFDPIEATTTQPVVFSAGASLHTKAQNAITLGYGADNTNNYSFVWSGDADKYYNPTVRYSTAYGSRLNGGFHVNPKVRSGMSTPLENFWIGSKHLKDWISELAPASPVSSVNSKTGAVVLDASDVGAFDRDAGDSATNTIAVWENYWGGSNVVFEVTNYYGNTSGEIPKLRILELMSDGGSNYYREVWNDANKFAVVTSNILDSVSNTITDCKADIVGWVSTNAAPLAWGKVTDIGNVNEVSNSVWMTSPQTVFAGGTEYQRVAVGAGAVCVLTTKGANTYTAGAEGTFRFQDDGGTNYFGFAKSASQTIGCDTDGITVSGTMITLRYDIVMAAGTHPIVYYASSLSAPITWTRLNNPDGSAAEGAPYTVAWVESGGKQYASINCGSNAQGFFYAMSEIAGEVIFETNMKARFDGGIVCTNTATGVMGIIRPTYDGSSVNWTWSAQ